MNEYDIDILRLAGQGYCCAQIVLQLALEMQSCENAALIRAMSALCHGFPDRKGTCGALSGAACLIALYAGKGTPEDDEDVQYPLLLERLYEWFVDYCSSELPLAKGLSCREIVTEQEVNTEVCGGLVAACFGQAITLLAESGYDLATCQAE